MIDYLNSDKSIEIIKSNEVGYTEVSSRVKIYNDYVTEQVYKLNNEQSYLIAKSENINSNDNQCIHFKNEKLVFSIQKFICHNNYHHVYIYCYNYDVTLPVLSKHIYYKSVSDCGFWRYCVQNPHDKQYDKGVLYVIGTLINMKLQTFLFRMENIFRIEHSTLDQSIVLCPNRSSIDQETMYRFSIMSIPTDILNNVTNNKFKFFEDAFRIDQPLIPVLLKRPDWISKRINRICQKYGVICRELISILQKHNAYEFNRPSNNENIINFYRSFYNGLSEFFNNHFIRLEKITKILENRIITIEDDMIKMDIYHTFYKEKESDKLYNLYFCSYRRKLISDSDDNYSIERYALLNITYAGQITSINPLIYSDLRKEAQLCQTGLEKIIIPVGSFIYKIYEYKQQTALESTSDNKYIFIGDIINMSWLFDRNIIQKEQTGGYYEKYIKYKQLYLSLKRNYH